MWAVATAKPLARGASSCVARNNPLHVPGVYLAKQIVLFSVCIPLISVSK